MQYSDLIKKYGQDGAFDMLTIIEKTALHHRGKIDFSQSENERLQRAISLLNGVANDEQPLPLAQ